MKILKNEPLKEEKFEEKVKRLVPVVEQTWPEDYENYACDGMYININ